MKLGYENNKEFYKKSIQKHGVSHKGVHWSSKYNQYIRFDILTDFIRDTINDSTIVDAGCGFGEYYFYLDKEGLLPKEYIGLDCEHAMIFRSLLRYPNLNFQVKNILEDHLFYADYYVCSGALSILKKDEFYTFIKNCYNFSIKGFVFNFLTEDSFNNIDKKEVINFCKKLCPKIKIKENYLYNDMTIYLEK